MKKKVTISMLLLTAGFGLTCPIIDLPQAHAEEFRVTAKKPTSGYVLIIAGSRGDNPHLLVDKGRYLHYTDKKAAEEAAKLYSKILGIPTKVLFLGD